MLDGGRDDGHKVRLAHAPLHVRAHEVAACTLVHQGGLGGAQAQLRAVGAGVQHIDEEVGACVERRLGQLHDACGQCIQLCLQGVGPVFEELVDVAQLGLHRPHRVDGALGDAHGHATLQHHKRRADTRDERARRVGHGVGRADEMVLEPQCIGARALHGREAGAFAHLHAGCVAAQQEHHLALAGRTVGIHHRRNRAAVVVGPQVAHPGQGAVDEVAALHWRGLEQQAFDLRVALHGVGQRRAAHACAAGVALQHIAHQRGVARLLQVQPAHRLAPHHEAGGAAHARGLGHGADGQAVVGRACGAVQVRAHRAHGGQLLQLGAGVVAGAVNRLHLRGQRALGNLAHGGQQRIAPQGAVQVELGREVGGVHGAPWVRGERLVR